MSELLHISITQPLRVLRLTAGLEENAQAFGSFGTIRVNSVVAFSRYSYTTAAIAEL